MLDFLFNFHVFLLKITIAVKFLSLKLQDNIIQNFHKKNTPFSSYFILIFILGHQLKPIEILSRSGG